MAKDADDAEYLHLRIVDHKPTEWAEVQITGRGFDNMIYMEVGNLGDFGNTDILMTPQEAEELVKLLQFYIRGGRDG